MEVFFEKARNNEWTCKVCTDDQKCQYVYSKYRPKESIEIEDEIEENGDYLVLGLGLGYEVSQIATRTKGVVYVLESYKGYLDFIMAQEELREGISLENIRILIGDAYTKLDRHLLKKCKVIANNQLVKYQLAYFGEFTKWLHTENEQALKRVLMVEHRTIMKDCMSAFIALGYIVETMPEYITLEMLIDKAIAFRADYIFTINFQNEIAAMCEKIEIPYISWTVDTPMYSLYEKEVTLSYAIKFVYDKAVVNDLKRQGVSNVYHLPVAVDSRRMKETIASISNLDQVHYGCDVSFVACLTESEYSKSLAPCMDLEDRCYVDEMIAHQSKDTSVFSLKQSVRDGFIERFKDKYSIHVKDRPYIAYEDSIAFLFGRYHSEVERVQMMNKMSEQFDAKVFGNDEWQEQISCYVGKAEHYQEMPKVFHLSKINLNMIRCFVESGLPMRVFDVLGAQGFLLTNDKPELKENFIIGKDLVVYRDQQDAIDIARYYLHHEEERLEISRHGYKTVQEKHTYEHRIIQMMEIVKQYQQKLYEKR